MLKEPIISDTPIPPLPISPSSTPEETPEGVFGQAAAKQEAEANAQNTQVAATNAAFGYECEKQTWATNNGAAWQKWNSERQVAINDFIMEFKTRIEQNKKEGFNNSRSLLYEAIQSASRVLDSECSKYVKCDLVIFSDLYDYRNYRPAEIRINLQNIEVAAMLLNCNFKYECQGTVDFWSDNFLAYGASDPHFALRNDVEKNLISYLGR